MGFMINIYLIASVSAVITFLFFIPFINYLYKIKMQVPTREKGRKDKFGLGVEVYDKIKAISVGTPTGGGVLIVLVTLLIYSSMYVFIPGFIETARFVFIMLGFLFFGLLGFYDDVRKVFKVKGFGMRVRHKMLIQLFLAFVISWWGVKNNLISVGIPFMNIYVENQVFLIILSMLTIIFMSNAYNILDGIDGLAAGSFMITAIPLTVFLVGGGFSDELVFLYILFGAMMAYLYFNINPARLIMGDTGALAFGAVIGMLTLVSGVFWLLPVFALVYIIDAFSSILQWSSMYFRGGKRIFKIAPIHHHFEALGWEGSKVVFRFWLAHAFVALLSIGLFYWGG